ncbi:4Fe-4S dicluster domain-containing protein [Candidatus Aerophobetes bacterium]|uniref:4Fe-4S dicluster domain-containing protein n=1 Tax=Aerophobetes bacterium TaxID=2030807 RepID=A0A523UYP9_UNCAE|nr:MAG: 4Fe-4S dicluster domain-containing protein [Candidatus Aerophobetes bacterium]
MPITRIHFWEINNALLFYILAALATLIFLFGLFFHVSIWLAGLKRDKFNFSAAGIMYLLRDGLLGKKIFTGDFIAGLMHLFIMWGFVGLFVGTVLLTIDHWLVHYLSGNIYLIYSVCLEIVGLMLIAGIVIALVRRYFTKIPRLTYTYQDLWILILLLAIALSGFFVEGIRLAAERPDWEGSSFIGLALSSLLTSKDQALAIYPFMWWFHSLLSLGLIAYFPFSKLFHSLAAPLSIYLAPQPAPVISTEDRSSEEMDFSFRDMIDFSACTNCGRCNEVCPSTSALEPFSPREFIAQANEYTKLKFNPLKRVKWLRERSLKAISKEAKISPEQIWYCTTCMACLEVCPVYIGSFDPIRRARMAEIEEGSRVPSLLIQSLEKLYKYNNPWESSKKKRDEWPGVLNVPDLTKGARADLCYFVGCTTSIDTRAQGLARAFVKIMTHAGISFGTLGQKETCCGDIARRVGEDGLFEEQMEQTLDLFARHGVTEVVTSSPHCFNAFRNEYSAYQELRKPEERVSFNVRHYSQLLEELMNRDLIKPVKSLDLKVTYHDPCYLGRHNHIYEGPRRIIRSLPGVELVEMAHFGSDSLCCGGGGGRMWEELKDEQKMSEIRIREAADTGASIVVTACPYCLVMLEDARKTADLEEKLRIMDLNELLAEALGLGDDEE